MSAGPVAGLQRSFPLDPGILGPGSAASLELTGSTDADIVAAVAADTAFPTRVGGIIDLAHIGLSVSGGQDVAFKAGQTSVGFSFSAGVVARAGIFDDPKAAITALGLPETPGLDLSLPGGPASRYALLRTGYTAAGSITGTHPIGGLGSVTFGVSGNAAGLSAVLHRFPANAGARTVLEETVSSWRLPRHALAADRLKPATWVVAEADGSLAVKIAASLGYNFDFVREAKVLGLSGDIGLKVDAGATATFGFSVSGRYLAVLGRESDSVTDPHLRLRLFKLSSNGLNLGLNLKIGVTGVTGILPNNVDDFVKAVFGVHGAQILKALQQIEHWTDKEKSVGQFVAGLVNEKALQLLKDVTGVDDPATLFNEAREKLLDALHLWDSLPSRASSELWGILSGLDAAAATTLNNGLSLLASSDEATQKNALLDFLKGNHFESTPAGKLISALADHGLLNLLDRLPEVRQAASTVQKILDGGVIAELQKRIIEDLDLQKVLDAVTQTDFNKLDSFLVGRLAAFFDKDLRFEDLKMVKDTINMIIGKRQEIYGKARKALNSRYGLDLAATWSRTSASTAVVDVVFDTSTSEGQELLRALLEDSNFDQLLTSQSTAITVNSAVLTHELTRKSTLDISLPHFSFSSESFNDAIATVEEDSSRVLLYNAKGNDVVKVKNKFNSSLSVTFAASVARSTAGSFPDLRIHDGNSATWSYQLLQAKSDMGREELETFTRPFILQYMRDQFSGETNLSKFYSDFDDVVDEILHNGRETFGDVCASYEVTVPGSALAAWAHPVADVDSAAKLVSRVIQDQLKKILPFYFFQDIDRLDAAAGCDAVLVWSALPTVTNARLDGSTLIFNEGKSVFWNHPDLDLRRAMVHNSRTAAALGAMLPDVQRRLEEAGKHGVVQRFDPKQIGTFLNTVIPLNDLPGAGDIFLSSLLFFESQIVRKAEEAFRDIQAFLPAATTAPSKAIKRLAEFAGDITMAFNKLASGTVFGGLTLRGLNQMVFVEASRVLDGSLNIQPSALLSISVLKPKSQRTFDIKTFPAGEIPPEADIVIAQRLVSA